LVSIRFDKNVDISYSLVIGNKRGGVGVGACVPEAMILRLERAVYALDSKEKQRLGVVEEILRDSAYR
jgi:hypothetical protein